MDQIPKRERVKCCVIGGAGFIGTHVSRMLLEAGRDVLVLGRRIKPDNSLPSNVTYVSGNYGSRAVLKNLFVDVAEVIDLAYSTVPQTSFADPVYDILSNLPASVGLLQEAAAAGIRKVVLVSSGGAVYGVAKTLPIREEHPTDPISPYGITKLTVEKYAGMYSSVLGLPVVLVRPSNAYGKEQRAFAGQGFIATAIHSIIRGQEVEIYGAEGTIRDYVHVSDVARGIVAALENGETGSIYNIGSGIGRSNLAVLREIAPLADQAGYPVYTKILSARRFDVPENILDSGRLHAVCGWRPQISFSVGIKQVWRAALATSI